MSEVKISTAFLFALRQSAGETPAIRWSRLLFRIAGISGSRAFSLCSFRFAGGTPAIFLNFLFQKNCPSKKIANTYFVKHISVNGYEFLLCRGLFGIAGLLY
jgi:hypothetical protein